VRRRLLLVHLGAACLGVTLAQRSRAETRRRPLIRLVCPDAPQALCDALADELKALAPGAILRRVPVPEPARRRDQVTVILHLSRLDARGVAGRLDWQWGGGTQHKGSDMGFDVMDTSLDAAALADFARGLLRFDAHLRHIVSQLER
jgi:hypothetical protein